MFAATVLGLSYQSRGAVRAYFLVSLQAVAKLYWLASREGELDLNDPKIWTQYYNKPEDYHALREIKRKLDPDDLFHSKFTLRPAEH